MSDMADDQVRNDFLAGRGQAVASANTQALDALLQSNPGGGQQTAVAQTGRETPPAMQAQGRAAAPPPGPDLPLGLKIENYFAGAASHFAGDVEGAWNQLKSDYLAGSQEKPAADFWGIAQQRFHQFLGAGKLPADAFALAVSPATAAADTAIARPYAQGVHALLPRIPEQVLESDANKDLMAIRGAGGEAGAAAQSASETQGAAEAVAGTSETPKPQNAAGARPTAAAQEDLPPGDRTFDIEGQTGVKLQITDDLRQKAADYLAGKIPDSPIQASLTKMAADPDLNQTISDIARFVPREGVKSDDVLRMNAYTLGLSPEQLLAGPVGKLPDDEHMLAWNIAINSGAEKVRALAQAAVAANTPEANEAFVRAFALQNKLEGDWTDTGTQMGRAFRARQLVESARSDTSQTLQRILDQYGPDKIRQAIEDNNPDTLDELKQKIAALDDPKKVSPFMATLRWMGSRSGLLYGWYNWLLSYATVTKKLASDTFMVPWESAVRYAAEKLGSGAVAPGETGAKIAGYVGSLGDAVRAAGKALRSGESQFYGDYASMGDNLKTRLNELANGAPDALPADQPTMAAWHYLRAALPTTVMGAADDFGSVMQYRSEVRALLWREATAKGLSGEEHSQYIANGMNSVPQAIHQQAFAAAERTTFKEPLTGLAATAQELIDRHMNIPIGNTGFELPFGRMIMPFLKFPANMAKWAYRNGPLPLAFPTAGFRAELAAGGASRDLAYARVGLGTTVALTAAALASGALPRVQITGRGPTDPQMNRAWLRAGYRPYSLRVGDQWYEFRQFEPIGMTLGTLADGFDIMRYAHEEDSTQLAWSFALGAGNAMLSKTYMQGFADFLEALHDPDNAGQRYVNNLLASLAMPNVAAEFTRMFDPWLRAHQDLQSAVAARTPGFSSTLPAQQDLWGRDIKRDAGFFPPLTGGGLSRMMSPVATAPDTAEPIDKWIWENREAFPEGPQGRLGLSQPQQVESWSNGPHISTQIKLSPQQLHTLRALTGNDLKDPRTGLGALDALNALVSGKNPDDRLQARFDAGSPAERALIVTSEWNRYRKAAKDALARNDQSIQDALGAGFEARRQALASGGAPTLQ